MHLSYQLVYPWNPGFPLSFKVGCSFKLAVMQRSTKCRQDSSEGSEYFVAFRSKEADHIALPKLFDFVYFCQAGNLCSWRYWMITTVWVSPNWMFSFHCGYFMKSFIFLLFQCKSIYILNLTHHGLTFSWRSHVHADYSGIDCYYVSEFWAARLICWIVKKASSTLVSWRYIWFLISYLVKNYFMHL